MEQFYTIFEYDPSWPYEVHINGSLISNSLFISFLPRGRSASYNCSYVQIFESTFIHSSIDYSKIYEWLKIHTHTWINISESAFFTVVHQTATSARFRRQSKKKLLGIIITSKQGDTKRSNYPNLIFAPKTSHFAKTDRNQTNSDQAGVCRFSKTYN